MLSPSHRSFFSDIVGVCSPPPASVALVVVYGRHFVEGAVLRSFLEANAPLPERPKVDKRAEGDGSHFLDRPFLLYTLYMYVYIRISPCCLYPKGFQSLRAKRKASLIDF